MDTSWFFLQYLASGPLTRPNCIILNFASVRDYSVLLTVSMADCTIRKAKGKRAQSFTVLSNPTIM